MHKLLYLELQYEVLVMANSAYDRGNAGNRDTFFTGLHEKREGCEYSLPFLTSVGKEKKSMAEFKLPTPRRVGI
jgi:hypothetical protein